jgi:hypothetical protein
MPNEDELRKYVETAWNEALPALRARLGVEPDRAVVDLEVIDGLLDSRTDHDPIDGLRLQRLRRALVSQQGGEIQKILGEEAIEARIERYEALLADGPIQKWSALEFADHLHYAERGTQHVIIVGGARMDSTDAMVERAVARLSDRPMRIDARKDLNGQNPTSLLTLNPAEVDIERLEQDGGRALLLRDLPEQGRCVWVIDGAEAIAADLADAEQRAAARRGFWQFVALIGRKRSICCHSFDPHAGYFDDREISLEGAVFLIRTSQTADDFCAETENCHAGLPQMFVELRETQQRPGGVQL